MKRMLALMMILALLPLTALAGEDVPLTWERQAKKFIDFPSMDGWRGHFSSVTKWTIVTPENLEENWELVAGRGDPEAEIRARYAADTFLFEAYSPDLPQDACFRAEVFETEATREIWHLRHWTTAERKEIREYMMSGQLLPDREVYSLTNYETNLNAYERGYFTNFPPATHESGRIRLHFFNGRLYVFSYAVTGRLAGAKRWYSAKEEAAYDKTPVYSSEAKFRGEALPRMPKYELTSAVPELVPPCEATVTGTVEAGSKFEAAMDGVKLDAKLDKKGNFTVKLPLSEAGEHKVVFTVSNAKYTTRTMEYKVTVSNALTSLTITEQPELLSIVGEELTLAGQTDPEAVVTVAMNEEAPVEVEADTDGMFRYAFAVQKPGIYTLTVNARGEEKDENRREILFAADYEDINDGIKAFSEELTAAKFKEISENVEDHIGAKVKISVKTKEITLNEQGLGLLCIYNAKQAKDQTKLYVNFPGYAQCQIGENMILTIYATVNGKRVIFDKDGEEEERIELTADYGTYLVTR